MDKLCLRPRCARWIILVLAVFITACRPAAPAQADPSTLANIALGNPSGATSDRANKNNYLIEKPQYALSYNDEKGEPNWVSWRLQASDIGDVQRQDNFHPEEDLPPEFHRILPSDYTGSGYDRGHMCDSKDRTSSEADNSETFSMANMLPQTADLNRHVWERLESYCRRIVSYGNQVYVVAGGYGSAGVIGRQNRVNVPSNCWKIVVVLPAGTRELSQINNETRIIAVDIPNIQGIADDRWQKYITTVADLEQRTGYSFLTSLDESVRSALLIRKDPGRATHEKGYQKEID